jgi:biopolymer transport protein ExbD
VKITPAGSEDDFEINVIPLIDVLLTLLMFFVLTTTFNNQAKMRIVLPEASAKAAATAKPELVVAVDRQGRYFIGANEVLKPGMESLKQAIVDAAGDERDRPVQLRADGRTPHQAVVTAMDALGQLGFTQLSIATVPTEAAPQK